MELLCLEPTFVPPLKVNIYSLNCLDYLFRLLDNLEYCPYLEVGCRIVPPV